ncbi:hypothetical protein NRP93_002449 [Clostridium botulinum]|nr:hypothetical protein [Clostridium botulinum]
MKHIEIIIKIMIAIATIVPIFYPNNYTYGIWTLLILVDIYVELRKKPKKRTKYIYFFFSFVAVVLYCYYLMKNR